MLVNVPVPPSVIHRLQYCVSQAGSGPPFCGYAPTFLLGLGWFHIRAMPPWPPTNFTSFMYDPGPAVHLQATARGLSAAVERPMPVIIFWPPLHVSTNGLGPPKLPKASVLF